MRRVINQEAGGRKARACRTSPSQAAGSASPSSTAVTSSEKLEEACSRPVRIPASVMGSKYVRLLEKQIGLLRDIDQEHGNRSLFLDDVFVMYLLAFFNPAVRSLRTLEDLSQTPHAQRHLSLPRICKSTLSDFNQLIDPERLAPILTALRGQLSRKASGGGAKDRDLHALLHRTVAVDGTFLHAVADVAWAVATKNNHGTRRHRARVDMHVAVDTWLPEAIVIPDPGESESDAAIRQVQPGKIYIYDRGYSGFALLRAHYGEAGDDSEEPALTSHFVVRYRKEGSNTPTLSGSIDRPLQNLPLTKEDIAAGVISDRVGFFLSADAARAGLGGIPLREVVIAYEENGKPKVLRIITNLRDVSAATIAKLYRYRWQVELFFRWFKSFGNFGHLLSHSREGALAHLYVTIIGVMLMYLHSGYRPSKYLFSLLSQVAAGGATLEDILPILRERERRSELDRKSAAKRREKQKSSSR